MASTSARLGTSVRSSEGWRREDVTDSSVQDLFVMRFTEIVRSYEDRKSLSSLGSLEKGPWYANDYALALLTKRQHARHQYMIGKDFFFHGYPPEGFQQVSNPSYPRGVEFRAYKLKPESIPDESLDKALSGRFSFVDCGSAVQLAMYDTICEIVGTEKFNVIFSGTGSTPMKLHPVTFATPLSSLGFVSRTDLKSGIQKGDHLYFENIPIYVSKDPNGEWRGIHSVVMTSSEVKPRKYVAFGANAAGFTQGEMVQRLIEEYNRDPIAPSSILSSSLVGEFERRAEMAKRMNPDYDPSRLLTEDIFTAVMKGYAPKPQCRLNSDAIRRHV
jgi:hypothetical protein